MATGTNNLSTIIESQFPSYISENYPLFVNFLQKYYEQLENTGQPLDLINNITKYFDIDTYTNEILKESAVLVSITASTAPFYTIQVDDSSSFPSNNGVIQIDNEIIFYQSNDNNTFSNCYRNISGTTKLGDIYNVSTYVTVDYNSLGQSSITHSAGINVYNLSNLFLYAFTRNFQNQYLSNFPEQSLKSSVDKSTLIKNIKSFYRAKGTEQSIQFLFNSIVSTETDDIPNVIYPKDYTLKSSGGNWINTYGLKVKLYSGDINQLIGQQITQNYNNSYSFAIVDNVSYIGEEDGENMFLLSLAPETIVGSFQFVSKTFLTYNADSSSTHINVYSTLGWNQSSGSFLIGGETIKFFDKTVNQFIVPLSSLSGSYSTYTPLYSEVYIEGIGLDGSTIQLIPFGVLYDLNIKKSAPYSNVGDNIQISKPGFFSLDPKVTQWLLNETNSFSSIVPTSLVNVSAIFQDDNYYYITSSGFPDYTIGNFTSLKDQRNLKLIKKNPTESTTIYPTPNSQVGVLINGVSLYGCKDTEQVIINGVTWTKNRYYKLKNSFDSNYGYYFSNNDINLGYGYGQLANPIKLRIFLNDNLNNIGNIVNSLNHSKIIGFSYDGYPIYGPYGYSDPNDSASSIIKMSSSYSLNTIRASDSSNITYPIGTFVEDYTYIYRSGTLDKNNGRFCVTPEYPNGTYAYFITIGNNINSTTEGSPTFPYIIGMNFYSNPVTANYNGLVNQKNLPQNVSRYRTNLTPDNGVRTSASIASVNSGGVEEIDIKSSSPYFSVNCPVYVDNTNTGGSGLYALVSSIKGKEVSSLETTTENSRILYIKSTNNCYLYDGDIITQPLSNSTGIVIGNVLNNNTFVIKTTSGTFNADEVLNNSSTQILNLLLNQYSTYSENSILSLTDGTNEIGRATVLNSTLDNNIVTIKVISGTFDIQSEYYIKSLTVGDTFGSIIIQKTNLSQGIKISSLNDQVALLKTSTNHGLSVNDLVNIDIIPDSSLTTTTYYVRKRIYQKLKLNIPQYSSFINDTGIGLGRILNAGNNYSDNVNITFTNVELIFFDQTLCRNIFGDVVGSNNINAVIGKTGNANNALATITIENGQITSVIITKKGVGYKIGDILTVPKFIDYVRNSHTYFSQVANDTLNDYNGNGSIKLYGNANIQTSLIGNDNLLIYEVLFVGFSSSETKLFLSSVKNISINDNLIINDEIVTIESIDSVNSVVTVLRGQQNTTASNHFNQTIVDLLNPSYNFAINSSIKNAKISSYDSNNQTLIIAYDINKKLNEISSFNSSSVIVDQSNPPKTVSVINFSNPEYNFEFSKDQNIWINNPIINIQEYYAYKFDTSDNSLIGSSFEISPNINHNIFTTEILKSSALPGNLNSWVVIKLGFGNLISTNTLTNKIPINYTNYYYYDSSGIISSDNSYLNVIKDSLQGNQKIIYITPNYFLYDLNFYSQYNGTGTITYTTTSTSAVGEINNVSISSGGNGYTIVPLLIGAAISPFYSANAEVVWNDEKNIIESVNVINKGLNYINPQTIVVNGDGIGAEFENIINLDGSINCVNVINNGQNYSYKPQIKIIESDVVGYCSSNSIGTPKTVKIFYNGSNYENDSTLQKNYTSACFLILNNFSSKGFFIGEEIVQVVNGIVVASGIVDINNGWRDNSNILKIKNITYGTFLKNEIVTGIDSNSTGNVFQIFTSIFSPDIRSYYDNQGYYISSNSKIGEFSNRISDSYYYQDYSYAIKSKTSINEWRNLINETVHPAGFKLFGEMEVDSIINQELNLSANSTKILSTIQSWNYDTNNISLNGILHRGTQNIFINLNTNSHISEGSALIAAHSANNIIANQIILLENFDGHFDESGKKTGTTTFNLYSRILENSFIPYSAYNMIVTLDGVLQEPNIAFTVNNSQITFSESPLSGQNFVCRYFSFDISAPNSLYFKQIKNISSLFDGITTTFNLNYEDNSSVQLVSYQNLIVTIDGVLQKTGITPLMPIDRSYYINKSVIPNQIIFTEAPKANQNFFAYDIGLYDILTVQNKSIESSGPFEIVYGINNFPASIVNSEFVLVFVNGLLQNDKNYNIIGSNIVFSESIDKNSNIYIIYWYGLEQNTELILFGGKNTYGIFNNNPYSSTPANEPYEVFENDYIRIHGENRYRKVLSDPYAFIKTDFNNSTYSSNINVENYNGYSFGNGLYVQANIENGSVISLTWNKRDYFSSFPQSNNGGYEDAPILNFISQPVFDNNGKIISPPQGGGAIGYAVCVDGQVIDIVLVSGGSGYIVPPLVYIAKKFDIIKSNTRKFPTEIVRNYYSNYSIGDYIDGYLSYSSIINEFKQQSLITSYQLSSLDGYNNESNINLTIFPYSKVSIEYTELIVSRELDGIILNASGGITNINPIITIPIETGFIDYPDPLINPSSFKFANKYTLGQLGSSFGMYEVIKFLSFGSSQVSSKEQILQNFNLYYPTVTIGDFTNRKNSRIDSTGVIFNVAIPSTNQRILEISISLSVPLKESYDQALPSTIGVSLQISTKLSLFSGYLSAKSEITIV